MVAAGFLFILRRRLENRRRDRGDPVTTHGPCARRRGVVCAKKKAASPPHRSSRRNLRLLAIRQATVHVRSTELHFALLGCCPRQPPVPRLHQDAAPMVRSVTGTSSRGR